MSVLVDATISGEFANSYADVAYADAYFLDHYDATKAAAWDALSDGQKQMLLVQACRVLNTARCVNAVQATDYSFFYDSASGLVRELSLRQSPVPYTTYQALQFPRNLDLNTTTGAAYIPEQVKMAQCEEAIYLKNFDETAMANRTQGILQDTVSVGNGQVHLTQQYAAEGSSLAPLALEFMRPFFLKSGTRMRRS